MKKKQSLGLGIGLIGSLCLGFCQAVAEPVAVRGAERGQGLLFSHDSHCYLITARHVVDKRPRAQVVGEGALTGTASLRFPFWQGMDLAVGVVRRSIADRCSGSIDDLKPQSGGLAQSSTAELVLIDDEGFVDRLEMRLTETRYLDLEAAFNEAEKDVAARQGMSGGFLFVRGKPVGMALEALENGNIRFMRIDEIHQNVARWIGSQSEIVAEAEPIENQTLDGGLPLMVSSTTAKAVNGDNLPENMLSEDGSFVFEPIRNAEVIFTTTSEETPTVSRIAITSAEDDGAAMPRRIVIFSSPDDQGQNWRTFWSGELSRDGILDTGPRAQTWARRIKIVIASAWSAEPIKIDQFRAY